MSVYTKLHSKPAFYTKGIIIIAAIAVLSACKKEHRLAGNIEGNWVMTAQTYLPGYDIDGDGSIDFDAFPFKSACDADDLLVFRKDGTGEYNEGETKCDPANPQTIGSFKWGLNDYDVLSIEENNSKRELQVIDAANGQLKISYFLVERGTTYTITESYRRR